MITVYFDVHCFLPKTVPTRFRAISVATSIKIGRFLQTPAFASGNPSPAKLSGNLYKQISNRLFTNAIGRDLALSC